MKKQLVSYPHMLLIGSSRRNIGKTHLATSLIRRNRQFTDIIGLKVTTIEEKTKTCPHGNEDCSVCSEIEGSYLIREEKDRSLEKDTSLLLNAGAKKVFWLIVLENKLYEGAKALLDVIPVDSVIVAESNRFRLAVQPGFFLMLINPSNKIKKSAKRVQKFADLIIETDGKQFDYDIDKIEYSQDKWQILRI
jgi:hypothetical protein